MKVLIDHKTAPGFEAIAEARAQLLKLGKKELEDAPDKETCHARKGSHVVAPVCTITLSLRFFFKCDSSAPMTRHVLSIKVASAGFLAGSLSAYNDLTS